MMCVQVTAQGVKVVQQSTFLKALGASVALALGGAVVAMLIDQYSNVPCTITGDCAQISTTMKGEWCMDAEQWELTQPKH